MRDWLLSLEAGWPQIVGSSILEEVACETNMTSNGGRAGGIGIGQRNNAFGVKSTTWMSNILSHCLQMRHVFSSTSYNCHKCNSCTKFAYLGDIFDPSN